MYDASTHDPPMHGSHQARRMSIVGTVDYMAPELAMNMEYNETVDVFSFAIVLVRHFPAQFPPF